MRRRLLNGAARSAAVVAAILIAQALGAVISATQGGRRSPPGISLSPSGLVLRGKPGQGHRQELRLMNNTDTPIAFDLVAQDIVARDGHRTFLNPGEEPDSIAATAVFSPKRILIPAGEVGVAYVTVTVPPATKVRAVAAIFQGTTAIGVKDGIAMTASLGALITFALSDDLRLEGAPPQVSEQTSARNLAVQQWVTNIGTEPVVPGGAMAVLNSAGVLVGRTPIEAQRLLPGERLLFTAEYPTWLSAGPYRGVVSLEYDSHVFTRAVDFAVAPATDDPRSADRR